MKSNNGVTPVLRQLLMKRLGMTFSIMVCGASHAATAPPGMCRFRVASEMDLSRLPRGTPTLTQSRKMDPEVFGSNGKAQFGDGSGNQFG
jgi:hypothetical protein